MIVVRVPEKIIISSPLKDSEVKFFLVASLTRVRERQSIGSEKSVTERATGMKRSTPICLHCA